MGLVAREFLVADILDDRLSLRGAGHKNMLPADSRLYHFNFSVTYLLLYSVIALSEFLTCPSMSLVV